MSSKVLKLGESLRALLVVAQASTPAQWREHHPLFCKIVPAWLQGFRLLEGGFERVPDGWSEMVGRESDLELAICPPNIDSETAVISKKGIKTRVLSESEKRELVEFSQHDRANRMAGWWLPLWAKIFPAVRGHRARPSPDGPVGKRGWRYGGIEVSDLHGGEPMDAMLELYEKPDGYSITPDSDLKKLAERINENCKKAGLPWRVQKSTKNHTLTKVPAGTKSGA